MNREIKFRAWDKSCKEMLDGNGFDNIYINLSGSYHLEQRCPDGKFDEDYTMGSYVLMQFTGLKDKNGKDIYEGDILRLPYRKKSRNVCVKTLSEYGIICSFGKNQGIDFWCRMVGTSEKQREVIGNIYENPELLD